MMKNKNSNESIRGIKTTLGDKKAFEMAISALVIIILGVMVLVGLILVFTGSINIFKSSTKPFLDVAQSSSLKEACSFACGNSDSLTYCCQEYTIDSQKVKCDDKRLNAPCDNLICKDVKC